MQLNRASFWRDGTVVPRIGQTGMVVPSLGISGLWSTLPSQMGHLSPAYHLPGLWSSVAISPKHHATRQHLTYTCFPIHYTTKYAVLPPLICPFTRGLHCAAICFMNASKTMHCIAGIRSVSSCTREILLMSQSWSPLS